MGISGSIIEAIQFDDHQKSFEELFIFDDDLLDFQTYVKNRYRRHIRNLISCDVATIVSQWAWDALQPRQSRNPFMP